MDNTLKRKKLSRHRRMLRVRKNLKGKSDKPRLSIYKSGRHLYAQLIDDEKGKTLVGLGTLSKSLQNTEFNKKSKDSARHIGEQIAKLAQNQNVKKVVFDRGIYKYHGIVAEFADAARKGGLEF
ncbi:MAG: 50S ribosomal protein L18 [Parachlamydiales bacterium]|nr:50S ribosomal protein L18 [Parachlamydiales bacterium]